MSDSISSKLEYSSSYSLADLRAVVTDYFDVTDAFVDVAGTPTFTLMFQPVKAGFKRLNQRLSSQQLLPVLRRGETALILKIFSKPVAKSDRKWLSILLFVATLTTIYVAGYFLWIENRLWSEILMPRASPFVQAAVYAACLAGIIGSHELGHKIVCSRHKLAASTPYFIPGFPPFGTFGALISLKEPPTNKDELFDIGVAGPLSGFAILAIVTILSMALGVPVSETQARTLGEQNLVGPVSWPSSPLIFSGIFGIMESLKIYSLPEGWTLVLGQTLFAAWVGSLVTFLNLLPIWQLDGGHVSRAVFGRRGHKVTSVVGLGVLVISGYWFFALFLVFLMTASRRAWIAAEPLEDVSQLSRWRTLFYIPVLAILVLSFVTPPG